MDYIVQEIGKEFFLIRSPEKELHRNIYLKRFISSDRKERVNMIFDPGTPLDYEQLFKILKDLIGGVQNINLIFISHQDPDITSNLKTFLSANPNALILGSIDTFRLVSMYGISERNFKGVETLKRDVVKISRTGHMIQFVPAYFCHFRGAMMVYDFESRVLFSGDFLAGVNTKKKEGVYATEESFEGISIFHQIYMPSKKALLLTIDRIGLLNPLPEVIAPQHGDVIKGDLIYDFLTKLTNLEVGLDLLSWTQSEKDNLIDTINNFLNSLKEVDSEIYDKLILKLKRVGEFTQVFTFIGDIVEDIKLTPQDAIDYIVRNLHEIENGAPYISLLVNSLTNSGLIDKLPKLKIEREEKELPIE
ncbi:MAG: MBL fold metallo-hydrolase [Caldisericia bacterium]|jgi:glyoxylase-like metal-dependent hydrolase (beta-lactamase superfamily II)|nr:MBL fold metallo-hydrolase [Caldisericia bacterium]